MYCCAGITQTLLNASVKHVLELSCVLSCEAQSQHQNGQCDAGCCCHLQPPAPAPAQLLKPVCLCCQASYLGHACCFLALLLLQVLSQLQQRIPVSHSLLVPHLSAFLQAAAMVTAAKAASQYHPCCLQVLQCCYPQQTRRSDTCSKQWDLYRAEIVPQGAPAARAGCYLLPGSYSPAPAAADLWPGSVQRCQSAHLAAPLGMRAHGGGPGPARPAAAGCEAATLAAAGVTEADRQHSAPERRLYSASPGSHCWAVALTSC
jgi:hypothetical protein